MSRTILLLGNQAPYTPETDAAADLIEHWSATLLTPGLLSSWTGLKNGYVFTAAGGLRPTVGSNITDENGLTHVGASFTGAQGMSCNDAGLLAKLGTVSALRVFVALQSNTPGALQTILELSASWFSFNGTFGLFLNDVTSSTLEATHRGAGAGLGIFRSNAGTVPLIDPGVIQVDFGNAAVGSLAQTLDGAQLLGGDPGSGSGYVSSVFANNQPLYLGARGGSSSFLFANISDIIICGPACTDAAAQRIRAFCGKQVGAVQA